ncbi:MAG: hypothetical protein ACR2QM_12755 [Longimicrobiales bacterium]
MQSVIPADSRPEAMADVPGVCEVALTRAVVQYRDVHEIDDPGGRIQDIGMAVVVDGRFASACRVIDLGSAQVKYLDLSSELVVLDWVYDPTLSHIRFLADAVTETRETQDELGRYCFGVALRILNRTGFTPLTRPTLLRIGFRDLCKDLDLHEGTVVRIKTAEGRLTRVHLDYEANTLVFRSEQRGADLPLELALSEIFRELDRRRVRGGAGGGRTGLAEYEVRFGVPLTFEEARKSLMKMRQGLNHLIARFEPDRFKAIDGLTTAFGVRETLDQLQVHQRPSGRSDAMLAGTATGGSLGVH